MNGSITPYKIDWAFTNLKLGKTPGTDGLTGEFYKTFKDLLSLHLQKVFAHCRHCNNIPDTWKLARLVLILKEGKDPILPGSYQPLCLLNVDYKSLASILAERLNKIIGSYVIENQTGFIRGRLMHDNIRKLVDVIEPVQKDKIPALYTLLDTEKAFDRVGGGGRAYDPKQIRYCPLYAEVV